jgi:hypothetical protein
MKNIPYGQPILAALENVTARGYIALSNTHGRDEA